MADHNQDDTGPSIVSTILLCVVPPIAAFIILALIIYQLWKCYLRRSWSAQEKQAEEYTGLQQYPPSSDMYEKLSLAASSSSTASGGSERYGSMQTYSTLLGRQDASFHEITSDDEIHYLDIPDAVPGAGELGLVVVSLVYNSMGLCITVREAVNLPQHQYSSALEPYVVVKLLPNEGGRFQEFQYQTTVKKRTTNPVYNEKFVARMTYSEVAKYKVQLIVMNYQRFARKDPIGETVVPLLDLAMDEEITGSYELVPSKRKSAGEILLSLTYLPTSERLLLGINQARNIRVRSDASRNIDACVRASLILGGRKFKRKKTTVKESDGNPVFDEKLFFEVPAEKLNRIQMLVVLTNEREGSQDSSDTDSGSTDQQIGHILLGYRSSPRAHAHWVQMMEHPRQVFAQWYDLRV